MLISPDDVDDRTVPVPAAHVALVEVDDGGVLVDEEAGRGYSVNATAALLWKLFDSVSPLGDLIDDVSAAFGEPRPDVAGSVHGVVRFLGELGLFENVTRNLASVPIDIEYVDVDDCGQPVSPGAAGGPSFDARYLEAPANAWLDKKFRLGEAVTEVYEVGGRRLGVRWSRAGLDAELRAMAAAALGVQDAPANLSVVVGETSGRTRSKHQLHVQGKLSATISGDGGLIRTVIRSLGALATEPPDGILSLNAFLIVQPDGAAVAVDRRLAADVRRLDAVIRRRGLSVVQVPHLYIRPERGTTVLADAAAGAGVAREQLDARWPRQPGDDDLAAGDVTISRFVYAGRPQPESRADVVADMVWMLRDATGRVRRAEVTQVAALTGHVGLAGVFIQDHAGLAAALGLS